MTPLQIQQQFNEVNARIDAIADQIAALADEGAGSTKESPAPADFDDWWNKTGYRFMEGDYHPRRLAAAAWNDSPCRCEGPPPDSREKTDDDFVLMLIGDDDSPYFEGWKRYVADRIMVEQRRLNVPDTLLASNCKVHLDIIKDVLSCGAGASRKLIELIAWALLCPPENIDPGYIKSKHASPHPAEPIKSQHRTVEVGESEWRGPADEPPDPDGWIAVGDELPEDKKVVRGRWDKGDRGAMNFDVARDGDKWLVNGRDWPHIPQYSQAPTHWRPISSEEPGDE